MTDPRIEAAIDSVIKEKPLYYNQEVLDRLTKAALDSMPKPIVDITVTHESGTLFGAVAHIHYE